MKQNRYLIFAAALAVFLFCIGCGNVTRKVKLSLTETTH